METLSSSVSSIKIPTLQHQLSFPQYFKTPYNFSHNQNLHLSSSSSATITKKNQNLVPSNFHSYATTSLSQTQVVKKHSLAATGYAAALVDISKVSNSLSSVNRGVKKLKKWLKNEQIRAIFSDPFVGEMRKGEILLELAEKGRLNKHLVTLMRVLVGKGRLEIVSEVFGEFERIYNDLCGTQVIYLVA